MATTRGKSKGKDKKVETLDNWPNWVQCFACARWDVFENYEVEDDFDEAKVSKMKLKCKLCDLEKLLKCVTSELAELKQKVSHLDKQMTEFKKDLLSVAQKQTLDCNVPTNSLSSSQLQQVLMRLQKLRKESLILLCVGYPSRTQTWKT